MPEVVDPLATIPDDELWNMQLLLKIACGRSKSALRKARRQHFCTLFENLKVESDLRGLPHPLPPYPVGDLKKGAT